MDRADRYVRNFTTRLHRQYGFTADPTLPHWQNVVRRIKRITVGEFMGHLIPNLTCHNLLQHSTLPKGTHNLLGLGLNFCLKHNSISKTTQFTFERLGDDIRRMYHMGPPIDDDDYNPKLYIKSGYVFENASEEIEDALSNFSNAIKREQLSLLSRKRKPVCNLTKSQLRLMKFLKDNDKYIIVEGDKNLGPCILDRIQYIRRGCLDHLSNTRNYEQLSHRTAYNLLRGLVYRLEAWLGKFKRAPSRHEPENQWTVLHPNEVTFFRRALKRETEKRDAMKLARFRMICKVHKTPWQTRPIVCCTGTLLNEWSKWLDYWLQKLTPHIPSYVKNSQQVLDELSTLNLPPNAKLFTTDANAMYNNIDTSHALSVIYPWLDTLKTNNLLPRYFPLEAVKEAMVLVMRNNIFEWGDSCFLQLTGTAMGTSAAVMWATIYYATHEINVILPKYRGQLLYFRRYIDDIFGIWIGTTESQWDEFCNDIDDFGILSWDIKTQSRSRSVNFLDLTLTIEGSRVISRTYQKEMNLYLYLPPNSAHPPGVIKGLIFGQIRRYHAQNTHREDYLQMVRLLYQRLIQRGWRAEHLRPLIQQICSKLDQQRHRQIQSSTQPDEQENRLFIHLTYHPDDISRKRIRYLYDKHLGKLLSKELGITRPVIAYSRPKNLGEQVTKARLHQVYPDTVSIVMNTVRAELTNHHSAPNTPLTDVATNPQP